MGDPFVRPGLEYQPHIEQVLLRNEGTLTLETTKEDWLRYQHRDTLATIILHHDQLAYLSLAENLPPAKLERIFMERMTNPLYKRHQTRTPNKGYREQPSVPDRLKDTVALYGNQGGIAADGEAFAPEENRAQMMQEVMSNNANMKNYSKLDRLRAVLDKARNELPDHRTWQELYMFLRTTEMCTEVRKEDADEFPKGQKLWIELAVCEEKRVPSILEMPNGLLVLPVFSMEECLDHYFCRTDTFESCWFPVPRMGTRWEHFCELPFPACVIGSLEHFCTLATVALPPYQFGILINPGQLTSKFITYPEMVRLSQIKQTPLMKRKLTLVEQQGDNKGFIFDEHLMTLFDTRKMELKRVEAHEVEAKMRQRPPIPPIAQLELHLLLFKYPEIEQVYVRTVDRPRWRTMLGEPERLTEIDIVPVPGKKPAQEFLQHLKRWSYMSEFHMDVHIELTAEIPKPSKDSAPMCVYTSEDGELLRSMYTYKGTGFARSIGYFEPLLDENGRKPYDGYNYLDM